MERNDILTRLRRFTANNADWPTIANAADEIERLRKERDEARRRTNSILTEIDCRIEHGAESNGHLEAIRSLFKENTDE